eukprot:5412642-Ditylum_brightwellii.AAC.1
MLCFTSEESCNFAKEQTAVDNGSKHEFIAEIEGAKTAENKKEEKKRQSDITRLSPKPKNTIG